MGLCFGCLKKGHYSKNCHKRLTCQKCKRPHPTILYYDSQDDKEPKDPEKTNINSNQPSSNTSHVRHTVGKGNSVTTSMIVPMWLHHKDSPDKEVLVYALLDDASDSTFIKSETLQDLGLKGPEIKLNLYTMLRREEICVEKISGLVVKRIEKEWPHLTKMAEKLHPYQSGTDVGISIGCKCLRAIKPREVVLGKGDDLYAVKTFLG